MNEQYYLDPDQLDKLNNNINEQDLLSHDPAYQKLMDEQDKINEQDKDVIQECF